MRLVNNGIREHITIIERYLVDYELYDFTITRSLCLQIYFECFCDWDKLPESKRARSSLINRQVRYIIQSLIRIKHKYNIRGTEGYVYILSHPKLQGIKIGSCTDVEDRLSQFNVGCPNKEYKMQRYCFSENNKELEKHLHERLGSYKLSGEWFDLSIDNAVSILKEYELC